MLDVFFVRRIASKAWAKLRRRASAVPPAFHTPQRRRLEATRQIIEASFLFDSNWYLQTYTDVAHAGVDPLQHYLTIGWREGRDPGPMFTTSAYLKANEDVARSGMNPLLHFVEFGLAEGREGFGDGYSRPSVSAPSPSFAEPNACVSFPRSRRAPVIWRRGYRLDREDPLFVAVGEYGAGYAIDTSCRAAVQGAVQWLRLLSGYSEGEYPRQGLPKGSSGLRLLDAWYVNAAQLRTRWDGDELPIVVRVFQCDPIADGQLCLVGEGAIASSLEFVDVHLRNPYFPLLIALVTPDGQIRSTEMFAFPSLCRGGTHYAELLWASAKQASVDVAAAGRGLTKMLTALIRGESRAAVEQIQVNLAGADGNGPLFRSDLRLWLDRVLQVDVVAGELCDSNGSGHHITQSSTAPARILRTGGATLVLSPDAAPTIASLIAHRSCLDQQGTARPVPLLVSRIDPSEPAVLIDVPADAGGALGSMPCELPWLMPNADGEVATDFHAAAIRVSSGLGLSDAQLLVPVSGPALFSTKSRAAITWLINLEKWTDQQLVQVLHTAALQRSAAKDAVALVGPSTNVSLAVAQRLFPGEVAVFKTRTEAIRSLATPLIGCIGGGVLLHDARTADCFASILKNEVVTTVSCVIVSAERRGGIVKTAIIDGGALIRANGQAATPAECAGAAAELWHSNYPVLRPSVHLWATRSALLTSWTNGSAPKRSGSEIHLCSSTVTATCVKGGAGTPLICDVPEARETVAKVEWFVG